MNNFKPTYRFYLSYLAFSWECTPLGKVEFKTEQESNQVFYREKLTGKLTFTGKDYKNLLMLEQSSDRCSKVYFEVEHLQGTQWRPHWKGSFSVTEATWDLSKCTVEASIDVEDRYSLLFEEWEKEVNTLEAPTAHTVSVKLLIDQNYEFVASSYTQTGEPEGRSADHYALFLTHINKKANVIGINREWKKYIYFREYKEEQKQFTEQGELIRPQGSGWHSWEETPTTVKWVRLPQLEAWEPYNLFGIAIQMGAPGLLIQGCNDVAPEGHVLVNDCQTWEIGNSTPDFKLYWEKGIFSFSRARKFIDVMNLLVAKIDAGLLQAETSSIISSFFTYPVNPVTTLPNALVDLMMLHKSDAKKYNSTEAATKALMSLKAMLDELRGLQVYWDIDEDRIFRLEHLSFYQTTTHSIDTRHPQYLQNKHKKKYEYLKSKMPRYEKLQVAEPANDDFYESVIEYTGSCINKKTGENTVSYQFSKFFFDIESLLLAPAEYSNDGFVLLTVEPAGTGYRVREEFSALQNRFVPNYHLSAYRIMELYYRHGRVLRNGLLNGVPTSFESVQKLKKQIPLTIFLCGISEEEKLNGFSPMARFQSELSEDAVLLTATHDIKSDTIVVELAHEIVEGEPLELGRGYSIGFSEGFNA